MHTSYTICPLVQRIWERDPCSSWKEAKAIWDRGFRVLVIQEWSRSRARTLHLTRRGIQPTWGLTCVCQSGSHVRLFTTPWTVARQASLSMEFSGQEYWRRLPFTSPGDLPDTGIKPSSSALQTDSLPSEPPGKLLGTDRSPQMHSMQNRGSNGLESIGNANNWGQENNYPTLNQCKAGFLEETSLNWALT